MSSILLIFYISQLNDHNFASIFRINYQGIHSKTHQKPSFKFCEGGMAPNLAKIVDIPQLYFPYTKKNCKLPLHKLYGQGSAPLSLHSNAPQFYECAPTFNIILLVTIFTIHFYFLGGWLQYNIPPHFL